MNAARSRSGHLVTALGDRPSPRQAEIYAWIFAETMRLGYQPESREICDRFGIRSPNGLMCHLAALQAKGFLRRSGGDSRAIRFLLLPDGVTPFRGFVPAPAGKDGGA